MKGGKAWYNLLKTCLITVKSRMSPAPKNAELAKDT